MLWSEPSLNNKTLWYTTTVPGTFSDRCGKSKDKAESDFSPGFYLIGFIRNSYYERILAETIFFSFLQKRAENSFTQAISFGLTIPVFQTSQLTLLI